MRLHLGVWIVIVLVAFSLPSFADTDCDYRNYSTSLENDSDLTLGGGTDRFYSSGISFSYQCFRDPDSTYLIDRLSNRLFNYLSPEPSNYFAIGFNIGQRLYTASDISLRPEEIDTSRDRPYAAWLFAELTTDTWSVNGTHLEQVFSVGCVGPCAQGESVQQEWHELFGFPTPNGWDLQVEDQIALQYSFKYAIARHIWFPWLSLRPNVQANLGSVFLDAGVGAELLIDPFHYFSEHSDNEIDRLRNAKKRSFKLYVVLQNDLKSIFYNGTLQGSMYDNDSPHTADPRFLLNETAIGLHVDYKRLSFRYRFVGRSTELEEQSWKFWDHKYGSFDVSYRY